MEGRAVGGVLERRKWITRAPMPALRRGLGVTDVGQTGRQAARHEKRVFHEPEACLAEQQAQTKDDTRAGKRSVAVVPSQHGQAASCIGRQGEPLPYALMDRRVWRKVLAEKLQRVPTVAYVGASSSKKQAGRQVEPAVTQTLGRALAGEIGARRTVERPLQVASSQEANEASDGSILPHQPEQMARAWNAERGYQRRRRSLIPADEELRLELVR